MTVQRLRHQLCKLSKKSAKNSKPVDPPDKLEELLTDVSVVLSLQLFASAEQHEASELFADLASCRLDGCI
jgi:hypothetical protein